VKEIKSIAVLMTCFNRKGKTIPCLDMLFRNQLPSGFKLKVYLVDDGCTDGTSDAVKSEFPDVEIIVGDGSLFWNGGMRVAWQAAMDIGYDYYLWLNDDVSLYDDAIKNLLATYGGDVEKNSIIIGATKDDETGNTSYSGIRVEKGFFSCSFPRIEPSSIPLAADTMNGNIVLIPREVTENVGNLYEGYTHGIGDYDYGMQAVEQGFKLRIAPGYAGECSGHQVKNSRYDSSKSLKERVESLSAPSGLPPVDEWLLFVKRNLPSLLPIFWLRAKVRERFPILWVLFRRKAPKHFK